MGPEILPLLMFASMAGGIGASVATGNPLPMILGAAGAVTGGLALPAGLAAGAGAGAAGASAGATGFNLGNFASQLAPMATTGIGTGVAGTGTALSAAAPVMGVGTDLASVLSKIYAPPTTGQLLKEGLFKGALPAVAGGVASSLMNREPSPPEYGGKRPEEYTVNEIRQRRQARMNRIQQLRGAYA